MAKTIGNAKPSTTASIRVISLAVKRAWRLYKVFVSSSLARELEFRANFIAKIAENVLWCVYYLFVIEIIFAQTKEVAGWTKPEMFVLFATVYILALSHYMLFNSSHEIPEHVRKGSLDFVVTKPVDSQFWVGMRRFNFNNIGGVLSGMVMLGYGIHLSQTSISPAQWAVYVLLVLCALVSFAAFDFMLMTLGIYFVRVDNLWVLGDSIVDVSKFPTDMFGVMVQRFLLFILPVAILGTVPAKALMRGIEPQFVVISVAWAVLSFIASRTFWRYSMRHYSSASS